MIFSKNKIYLIAEIANSHEGKFDSAIKLIDAASDSNADIIKFQIFKANELLEPDHENFKLFKKLEFNFSQWSKLVKHAKSKNLLVFTDVFGTNSAKIAYKLQVHGYKIHTSDITNPSLLDFFSELKTTILLSTGGVNTKEISNALEKLDSNSKEIVLMHGFQGYPTKNSDLHLSRIKTLKKKFGFPVGIMEHVSGNSEISTIAPLLGISLGATIIEKHLTLDRSLKGIDHFSSLNPDEFKKLSSLIKITKQSLGKNEIIFSKNELEYRLKHKKNTIAKNTIKKDQKLHSNLFLYKRTRQKKDSISYYEFEKNIASSIIKKGEILTRNKIQKLPKVAAVIACRVESGRLFGKPIQNIGDFSILHFLIQQIRTSSEISEIVLAISENQGNEIFIDFAKKNNLKFVIGDDRDVLKRLINGAKLVDANIIFRVTSENPFIFWEGIDKLIKNHIKRKFDFSFIDNIPIGSGYEIINLKTLEKSHKLGNKRHRSELCSLYVYEHQKNFSIFRSQPPKDISKPNIRLTVDTPEDLLVARKIFEKLGKDDNPIPLKKVIKFLEKNPQIAKINSNIPIGVTRIWD
jgi:N,N'-diacetyllegionaminate synthase